MTRSLSRRDGRPAAPVAHVHLGLGNFFRAHLAWYSEHSPDRDAWGIAAFTGRSAALAETLTGQDDLYTLVTRAASGDRFEVISSLSATHAGADDQRFMDYLAAPQTRVLSLTVTEAAYHHAPAGGLDIDHPDVRADVAAMRAGSPGRTIPARIVAGLTARRASDAGPLTVLSCDNLPGNGAVSAAVTLGFANLIDPDLAEWIEQFVSFPNSVVDRITPRLAQDDLGALGMLAPAVDHAPVVTEPFSEWIVSGAFAGGRPGWDRAGAVFTEDITPFEHRKLWLLNGAHSLLAYGGVLRGHATVAEAIADPVCRSWVEQWWDEAADKLPLSAQDILDYRAALTMRFANNRIQHQLAQIATDGSLKLPIRVLPVLRAERAAGRLPVGAARTLAAWLCHLRGGDVADPAAAELRRLASGPLGEASRQVLAFLDPELAEDEDLISAVTDLARELLPGASA